jgi:hypothetical protein
LQSIFDNSKKGVIYVSFGSVAKSFRMPPHIKQAFTEAFKEFPDVDFIWKYEHPEDGTVEKLPNLHLNKWLPQTDILGKIQILTEIIIDILAQKKLLAFVTHSGKHLQFIISKNTFRYEFNHRGNLFWRSANLCTSIHRPTAQRSHGAVSQNGGHSPQTQYYKRVASSCVPDNGQRQKVEI